MTPLTVAAVWVDGQVPYTVDYVVRLRAMVSRHLTRPHRFVCLTDRPDALPADLDTIRIALPPGLFGWWAKVELFNAAHGLAGRVLYLDLDTLVVHALDPIVEYPAWFALVPPGGTFQPRTHQTIRRFNSSVMVWETGHTRALFEAWTPAVAAALWGDQDWIGQQMPDAATMPATWFPRLSELRGQPPSPGAIVVLAKKPKNAEAAQRWPWVDQAWGAA